MFVKQKITFGKYMFYISIFYKFVGKCEINRGRGYICRIYSPIPCLFENISKNIKNIYIIKNNLYTIYKRILRYDKHHM